MARRDEASEELLFNTLRDFTSKENWDKFFTIRGGDDPFEWYAEWAFLRDPLLSQLSVSDDVTAGALSPLQILVPGCGNSRLSEHLYDAGFRDVTNIDFSKVVVSDMLRRNVRSRPEMRWRVMDMTQMQHSASIPTYCLLLFCIPIEVAKILEHMVRDFPWEKMDGKQKYCGLESGFVTKGQRRVGSG